MRLLIDMNLSPRRRETFEKAGIEAQHRSDAGSPTAADAEIMAYAADRGFTIVTLDLDFGAILAVTKGLCPNVVQLRADDTSPEVNGTALLTTLRQCEADFETGALTTVDAGRYRLSILPLRQ